MSSMYSWVPVKEPYPVHARVAPSSIKGDDIAYATYSNNSPERIFASRPMLPQPVATATSEEISDSLLDKLEQAGRVPSKEKFRRMACNVRNKVCKKRRKNTTLYLCMSVCIFHRN